MNILEFNEQEFEEALESGKATLEESGESLEEHMDLCFKSFLFLGSNIKESKEFFDIAVFNIRLCYTYYKGKEDYLKVAQIVSFVKSLSNNHKNIVDDSIINQICVNLN